MEAGNADSDRSCGMKIHLCTVQGLIGQWEQKPNHSGFWEDQLQNK